METQVRGYNKLYAEEKVIIESGFGQLKERFSILGNCKKVSFDNVSKVICGKDTWRKRKPEGTDKNLGSCARHPVKLIKLI